MWLRQTAISLIVVALLIVILCACCHRILREPVNPMPSGFLRQAPWGLNRELLDPRTTENIVFLVQVIRGRNPDGQALAALVGIATKYGERPAHWIRFGSDNAPRLDVQDSGVIRCLDGPLDTKVSYVLVRYIGNASVFGEATVGRLDISCGARPPIYRIDIAQQQIDQRRFLWLTSRRLEERALVHEYGHLLGLGTNPSHLYFPGYPDLRQGAHCVNPHCVLSKPRFRAILYTIFRTGFTFRNIENYCRECHEDIKRAKSFWRDHPLPDVKPASTPSDQRWMRGTGGATLFSGSRCSSSSSTNNASAFLKRRITACGDEIGSVNHQMSGSTPTHSTRQAYSNAPDEPM